MTTIMTTRAMTTGALNAGVRRRVGYGLCLVLALATALLLGVPQQRAQAAGLPDKAEGIMCEQSDDAAHDVFNLEATSGYITTPDGNAIYSWSYTASGRSFQLPGPTLCVGTGDPVTVILHNTLREDTSIVFAGQRDVKADGRPVQPQFTPVGTPATATLTSLVDVAKAATRDAGGALLSAGTVTYTFTAGAPGTYLYGSGTDVLKQRDMGLYGGLVVRPKLAAGGLDGGHDTADGAGNGNGYGYDPQHEYLYVLSQVDPDLHSAVEVNKPYNYNASKARYFLINGRSMPDTLAPNNAAWLPSQPYGALIHIQPTQSQPNPALVRYVNAGSVNYPFHPHGSSQRVVNRDGAPVVTAGNTDASYLKFLVDVGPGQTADTLESWTREYDTDTKKIPSDVQVPQLQDQVVGAETWFSQNPYLGGAAGPSPNNVVQNNQCGEYYQVAHSHALYQATNYGASFGGMMTLIRIDPTDTSKCPAQ